MRKLRTQQEMRAGGAFKQKKPLFSGSILQCLFLRFGVGLFYEVNDSFECLRIVHREVGEGFAVKLDALLC